MSKAVASRPPSTSPTARRVKHPQLAIYLLEAAELGEGDVLQHPALVCVALCLRWGGGREAATGTGPIIQMSVVVQPQGVLGRQPTDHFQHRATIQCRVTIYSYIFSVIQSYNTTQSYNIQLHFLYNTELQYNTEQ